MGFKWVHGLRVYRREHFLCLQTNASHQGGGSATQPEATDEWRFSAPGRVLRPQGRAGFISVNRNGRALWF